MLSKKTILLISPEPWEGIFVSKHHYAEELTRRDNLILFLNPPVKALDAPLKIRHIKNNLILVDYKPQLKGAKFLPAFIRNWIENKFLLKLEQLIKRRVDIVWNFENSRFFDLNFASRDRLKIYHQVDLNQNFNPRLAAQTADIVFAVNDPIKESLLPFNDKVYKITHGLYLPNNQGGTAFQQWKKYFEMKRPKVVYVGNLDSFYLDTLILKKLIISRKDVDFFLIGPYRAENEIYQTFNKATNVFFVGKLPYYEIGPFLYSADILLLVYKADQFSDYLASSHKVLEYLASGNVIVSSFMKEYEHYNDLLNMARNNSEIPLLFDEAINNLERYNTPSFKHKRKEFALGFTYSKQLDRIIQKLKEHHLIDI